MTNPDPFTDDELPTMFYSRFASAAMPEEQRVPEAVQQLARRGYVALSSGDLDAAECCFQEASVLQQADGPARSGMPQAFGRLGLVAAHRGDLPRAHDLFDLGLELARAQRTRLTAEDAMLLHNLGVVARMRGRHEEAARHYTGALAIKVAVLGADHPNVATTLAGLGFTLLQLRRPADALGHLERARRLLSASTDASTLVMARALLGIGHAQLQLARPGPAELRMREALALAESLHATTAQLARHRFGLACACWYRDADAGLALAARALGEAHRARPRDERLSVQINAWLDRRTTRAA